MGLGRLRGHKNSFNKYSKIKKTHRIQTTSGLSRQRFRKFFGLFSRKRSKTHKKLSKTIEIGQNRFKSDVGACQNRFKWCGRCFKRAGRGVGAVLLKARLSRSLFRLDFPKTHFSYSHSFWRRVFQISFSESAPLRFAFLKAHLSGLPYWRRASQIRLPEDAPFGD